MVETLSATGPIQKGTGFLPGALVRNVGQDGRAHEAAPRFETRRARTDGGSRDSSRIDGCAGVPADRFEDRRTRSPDRIADQGFAEQPGATRHRVTLGRSNPSLSTSP